MKSFAVQLLLVTLVGLKSAMPAQTLKVDHTPICGSDLNDLQNAFARVGLAADYGGPHARGGTQMAVLGFADGSYIELIAPQKAEGKTDSSWSKLMLANAGPCSWAVLSTDIQKDVDQLKAAGFAVDGPASGGRKKPDGKVLQWLTAGVGSQTPGAVLPFMIQDLTPRAWRVQPSVSARFMKLTGIDMVVLGVKDLSATTALFRKAYGWPEPRVEEHHEFGAKLAHFEGTPVILATPLGADSWLAKRLSDLGEIPAAVLLGTSDWKKVESKAKTDSSLWFGRKVAWLDAEKLRGVRLGVVEAR